MTDKDLIIIFNTSEGETLTLRISKPHPDLTTVNIKTACDDILADNVLGTSNDMDLTSVKEVYYEILQEEEIEVL